MPARFHAKKALCLLVAVGLSATALAESLKQAVEETVDSNPDVLIAAKSRLADNEFYKQARAGYFPTVDLNAGYGRQRSKNPSVANRIGKNDYDTLTRKESGVFINQLLFDGFGTPSEVAKRRANSQASAHEVGAVAQDLGLDAVHAYIEVLKGEELVSLAKANLSAHRRTHDMIKQRSSSGLNREADVDQATGRLALAQANLQARESDHRDAKIEYLRVVGRAPQGLSYSQIPKVSVPANQEQVVALATANHPRLFKAKHEIDEANANYYVAKSLFWPRLDAQFGGNWDRNISGSKGTSNDYFAMLRMKYNVFNGGGDVARVREAHYRVQRAQEFYNLINRQVGESARLSWNDYLTAKSRLSQLNQHKDSSHKTVTAYRKQFQLGKRSLLDLLDSENELFNASNAYTTDKYDELFARYRILNSMGTLLQTLGVALPIEAYDEFANGHLLTGSTDIQHPNVKEGGKVDEPFLGPVYSANSAPQSRLYAQAQPIEVQPIAVQQATMQATKYAAKTQSRTTANRPQQARLASAKQSQQAVTAPQKSFFTRSDRISQQQIARIKANQQRAAMQFAQLQPQPVQAQIQQMEQPKQPQWIPIEDKPQLFSHANQGRTAASQAIAPRAQRAQALSSADSFNVQVATFSDPQNAERLTARLRSGGYQAFVKTTKRGNKSLNQVLVAPQGNASRRAAEDTIAELNDSFHIQGIVAKAEGDDRYIG